MIARFYAPNLSKALHSSRSHWLGHASAVDSERKSHREAVFFKFKPSFAYRKAFSKARILSSDSFDMRGCFTELEISSGVHRIFFRSQADDDLDDDDIAPQRKPARNSERIDDGIDAERLKNGAKLIAGLDSAVLIKRRLIQKLMRDNIDYAIGRYLRKEGVPPIYSNIVDSKNCIETLISGILYKVCGMSSNMALNNEIAELCASLKENSARSVAYDRVGLIQRFVHDRVDGHFGVGAAARLPVKHMRNLLSVARLHLNLHDINSRDESYALYMDGLSTAMSNFEYFSPKETALPAGKTFFPKWRVRHLRPLSHFYQKTIRQKLSELDTLDDLMPAPRYAAEALQIYATTFV